MDVKQKIRESPTRMAVKRFFYDIPISVLF